MPEFDRSLSKKKIVFLDLDGTVYLGENLLPGAKEFLEYLSREGIKCFFLSNNSSRSKKDYVKKLSSLGIKSDEESIILSTDGVLAYLRDLGVREIYTVGTQSMQEMFTQAHIKADSKKPEYIVLGYDTELTYAKLRDAALFMQKGVELLVTHPDIVCPTPEGPIPDTGAMIALLEKSTGKNPLKIFGKPNVEMISHILQKHGVAPHEVVMIGDRIYTDMELANRLPCDFILVLSGETNSADIPKLKVSPALIAENIGQIRKQY